ncbi:hypothetical protein F9L33_02705 [Amylibacter sp. SFDW26]|uniref:hypothetical protein n=1 Tax=Amylibacter sp. SFDW26 TaxID=2652722 RepID=UPI00126149F9|nr:hypothetical protein [Amylibacter sp. SFDW26]KAB7615690.1 hypothetical protein F9L33_02705 [Amylibacter sp. SFDW26]
MALNYDFDVAADIPRDLFLETPAHNKDCAPNSGMGRMVMFRDPKTVTAFNAAPKKIQKIFCDARFGNRVSLSRMAKGFYPEIEDDFRTFVFQELEKNLKDQLTDQELEELLNDTQKPKKYCFFNRMKKNKPLARVTPKDAFNVRDFIHATTSARCVKMPKKIVENLKRPVGSLSLKDGAIAFCAALAPRLFILSYTALYAVTQVSVFA